MFGIFITITSILDSVLVLDKIKSEGLIPTLETVFNKLEQPLPLGYCNVGEVMNMMNKSKAKVKEEDDEDFY